jgi:hypothetical protein
MLCPVVRRTRQGLADRKDAALTPPKPRHDLRRACHGRPDALEAAIARVVRDFKTALPDAAVHVYDNNSTDRTAAGARAAGAVVRAEPLQGKGNVVRRLLAERLDMVNAARVSTAEAAYRPGHRFGNLMLTTNPPRTAVSVFVVGFGLMQRDRDYDHYRDVARSLSRSNQSWKPLARDKAETCAGIAIEPLLRHEVPTYGCRCQPGGTVLVPASALSFDGGSTPIRYRGVRGPAARFPRACLILPGACLILFAISATR